MALNYVHLSRGWWLLVCPCGFRYLPCRVDSPAQKMGVHCFKCKQNNGKYYRVMEQVLEFSHNWNNKLNCGCFTTWRRHNPLKYYQGAVFNIYLKGVFKGKAKVVDLRTLTLDKMNDFGSMLDTGYPVNIFRDMLQKMYQKHRIDWEIQKWDYCLLQYVDSENKKDLFENE